MNGRLPHTEHDHVLAGVKAKPFGWPAASLDTGSGRGPRAASGSPLQHHPANSSHYGSLENDPQAALSRVTR
jgi:hypothetical protein